jgi:hypothetical protein
VKVGGPNASKVPQLLAQQLYGQRQYPLHAADPGQWGLQQEQSLPGGQAVHNGGILRLAVAGEGQRQHCTLGRVGCDEGGMPCMAAASSCRGEDSIALR